MPAAVYTADSGWETFYLNHMTIYFAHPSAIVDQPCSIGAGTTIWHFSHIMKDSTIGTNCSLGQNVFIASGVILGNNVKIQNNVSVYRGVICEDDVFLGPSMVFTNVMNPRSTVSRKNEFQQTIVKKGASIGANATIICGTTIGEYALVGAGAVITRDVKPHALVAGNPARQIGWVCTCGERLQFSAAGIAECAADQHVYTLENGNVKTKYS